MVVGITYDQGGNATATSTEIVTGVAPARFSAPPEQIVKIINSSQQLVEEFPAWSPLVANDEQVASNTGRYIFPFMAGLNVLQIIDTVRQQEIARVDLEPAIDQFCDSNPSAAECIADVAISIVPSAGQVIAGTSVSYTLTVTNSSAIAATNTIVTQTLPYGTIFDKVNSSSLCMGVDGTVVCGVGIVSALTSISLPVVALIDLTAPVQDVLSTSAVVTAKQVDLNLSNNNATASVSASRRSDLAISKVRHTDRVAGGHSLAYEVMVNNLGDSIATGVVLSQTLSQELSLDPLHSSQECQPAPRGFVCHLGLLANHDSRTVAITTQRIPMAYAGTVLTVTSRISADETDLNLDNNTVTDTLSITSRQFLPAISVQPVDMLPSEIDLIVSDIEVGTQGIQIVIQNVGTAPLSPSNSLWVDVYLSPEVAPTRVNQVWSDLGDYGLAWGVVSEGVRIMPGGQLALNVGDSYFIRELSQLPEVLPAGAEIYAQVDSAKVGSDHGAVFDAMSCVASHTITSNLLGSQSPLLLGTGWPTLRLPKRRQVMACPCYLQDEYAEYWKYELRQSCSPFGFASSSR